MKKSKQKSKSIYQNHKKLFLIPAIVLVPVFVISQLVFDVYIYRNSTNSNGDTAITNLLISAVRGLQKPAPVDPITGKVYLSEAKLVLPAPTDAYTQIRYSVGPESELMVTSSLVMGQSESRLWSVQSVPQSWKHRNPQTIFDEVPSLQACARGVQIFTNPQSSDRGPGFQQKATKALANGQTLYFYTESTCKADLSGLLEYLKQVESF